MAVTKKKNLKVTITAPYLEGMNALIGDGLYESQANRKGCTPQTLQPLRNHLYKRRLHPTTVRNNKTLN